MLPVSFSPSIPIKWQLNRLTSMALVFRIRLLQTNKLKEVRKEAKEIQKVYSQEINQATLKNTKFQGEEVKTEKKPKEEENIRLVGEHQVKSLKQDKTNALKQVENLTVLTQSSSDNIKSVISQLSEKDKYINGVRKAMTQKDSLNLAIKYHLTKNLTDGIQDKDIEVNVEKTVVFISISDKLLFKSGSYNVTDKAYTVLEKIAKVIKAQPAMEVMIEGHTDSKPIKTEFLQDNWDLSAKRATSIARILQTRFNVEPRRMSAAGRSSYVPLVPNDSEATKNAYHQELALLVLLFL